MASPTRHIVFDLGKVLVHFSYSQLFPLLRGQGAEITDVEEFAAQVGLVEYEHGRLSNADFLQRLNNLLSSPLEEEALEQAWCQIFTPNPQMLQLLRGLRPTYGVYIISNTSDLHWRHLKERFALDQLCDDCFASCEVGHMKPKPEIYRLAEQRFGFKAEEAIFIDDRRENVTGAINCGWSGIHHLNYGDTLEQLRQLGIFSQGPEILSPAV